MRQARATRPYSSRWILAARPTRPGAAPRAGPGRRPSPARARMPAYVIEFQSGEGPQRRRFTLDDDRPLRGQLEHVLAELERARVVLQGGPTDELAVYWAGRELDPAQAPLALGITADRPLELRMQRRRPAVTLPAPAPEPPPEPFVPKSVGAGAALGLAAGALAWVAAAVAGDWTPLAATDAMRDAAADVAAALAWGALVGAAVGWGQARRAGAGAGRGLALGLAAGALAGAAWGVARGLAVPPASAGALVAWRAALWALLAAVVALALAGVARVRGVRATAGRDPARPGPALARAAAWAAAAGGAAGLVGVLPGEAALWQALAAALAGAGVGAGVAWGGAHAAPAVFELEAERDARGERPAGVATLREWALGEGVFYLGAAPGEPGRAAAIVGEGGRYRLHPDAGAPAARELRHGDRLALGPGRYRFRRRVVAA